jgi:CRISPR system Cascade subunit CasE
MTVTLMHCQPNLRRMTAWAAGRRYLNKQGDLGYALHALLRAAFGEQAPQPFCYLGDDRGLLAYSSLEAAVLQQLAAVAAPDVAAVLGLDATAESPGVSARRFPEHWAEGQRLNFEVRVRPIVRSSQSGRERDLFLRTVEQQPEAQQETLSRETVYREWLQRQFASEDAAQVLDARMTRFQLSEVTRQTQAVDGQPRRAKPVTGPDAVFAGQLRVHDSTAFSRLISRGIGRHRAFGFGMLLIRPAIG